MLSESPVSSTSDRDTAGIERLFPDRHDSQRSSVTTLVWISQLVILTLVIIYVAGVGKGSGDPA